MAYARRNRRSSKKLTANRVYRKRPTASNQQHQIATLAKKVNKVSKTLTVQRDYKIFSTENSGTVVQSGFVGIYHLINPDNWAERFHTDATAETKHCFRITSVALDVKLTAHTEHSLITHTLYVFKIKPDVRSKVINSQNDLVTFTDNQDFIWNGGMALLNRNKYDVVLCRRFFTEKNGADEGHTRGPGRCYKKFKTNCLIKNSMDEWQRNLTKDIIPPKDRLYMALFNDNTSGDNENPLLTFTTLATGYAY